ncbi:MAG TPA: amino acid ABC transporter permease [Acidimicrobiia bacterium]|nr:amino acid ABC transporter permease [Acidimicrobiia bacterium]
MTTSTVDRSKPPGPGTRASTWARRHLFRNWGDSALTVVFGGIGLYVAYRFFVFVFVNARWEIIETNLKLLMVGRWPVPHLPRIAVAVGVFALWGGLIAGLIAARQMRRGAYLPATMTPLGRAGDLLRRFGLVIATGLLLLAMTDTSGPWLMAAGAVAGGTIGRFLGAWIGKRVLPRWVSRMGMLVLAIVPFVIYFYLVDAVPLAEWEGFFFNITSAAAGIILCFPLGVLLALGRRSQLPLLRTLSVGYIEFVRAAPLYVLLLLANVSLEFFVPPSIAPSKVTRAVVTFTLFTAAYLAEIVRGGLQSVPRGQEEAAKALGLSPTRQIGLIILPQALRNVIPAQIGQFISLFKDTTLAGLALGILDMLSVAQAITQQDAFRGQGLIIETLVFVGFMFWVGSFTMSRESQRLERKLGVGNR